VRSKIFVSRAAPHVLFWTSRFVVLLLAIVVLVVVRAVVRNSPFSVLRTTRSVARAVLFLTTWVVGLLLAIVVLVVAVVSLLLAFASVAEVSLFSVAGTLAPV
jgi:hypothetical protein